MEERIKSGFVSVIGRPNVGKSTLINNLIGQKISIMSNKPQTTRNTIQAIINEERGQIVFLDTPGIHQSKNKLGEYMNSTALNTLNGVDLILYLIEPSKVIGKGDNFILEKLKSVKTPVILVINKIDTIEKKYLLEIMDRFKDEYEFKDIIPISALSSDDAAILEDRLFDFLDEGPRFFPEEMVTDQPERQIIAELIREKALQLLQQEIPHGIAVVIDQMKKREKSNLIDIDATIICEKNSHKGIIIGKQGAMLKKIGTFARKDMEKFMGSKINLKIWVKIKKDWRDSEFLLKNYGFNKNEM